MALDLAAEIERAVVPDGGESPLGQGAAVVEDPLADPDTQRPPDKVLERGAVEHMEVRLRGHLPQPLDPPEIRVVDRAVFRLQPAESPYAALYQHEVDRRDQDADREPEGHLQLGEPAVRIEGGQREHGDQEDMQP